MPDLVTDVSLVTLLVGVLLGLVRLILIDFDIRIKRALRNVKSPKGAPRDKKAQSTAENSRLRPSKESNRRIHQRSEPDP